jgi:AraC family ethanolamine operon transcriptional activator
MSPTAYLRVTALNAVRRELVEGSHLPGAVSRTAADWGFWHLSRFAAQYRELFGESPRHTLSHQAHLPQTAAN